MSNDLSRRNAGAKADRDHILDQALRQEMRAEALPVTPQCLDAETLAAWGDGGLDAAAMENAEIHVSTCARCQAVLGAIAKGTPATEPVVESKSIFSWHWWFAPLAATAAAVTLWMVVPEQQPQMASAPPPTVAPAREVEVKEQARGNTATPPPTRNTAAAAEAQDALKDRAQAPAEKFAAREDRRERQGASSAIKEETGNVAAQETARTGGAADALSTTTAPAAAPLAPAAASPALQKRSAVPPVELSSPDGVRRWRAVETGIEYSVDRGASWIPVRAVGTEVITGGKAVSGSICWLIGRGGVVLITVDGMTFAKVDLPVRVDVTSIAAKDARSAVVTTADGRTFLTDDSGRNWRQN